jgi:hypothetical protein
MTEEMIPANAGLPGGDVIKVERIELCRYVAYPGER